MNAMSATSHPTTNEDDLNRSSTALTASQQAQMEFDNLRKAAEKGDADAQTHLGTLYANGLVVPQDHAEAVQWYRLAAEQGNATALDRLRKATAKGGPEAQFSFGELLDRRCLTVDDKNEAFFWLSLAANQGHTKAQNLLALKHSCGYGVDQDHSEALRWYRQAADRGDSTAQYCIGRIYAEAKGVEKDMDEAQCWYRLAAEQGNAYAQQELGYVLLDDEKGTVNDEEAARWINLAAEQGRPSAQIALAQLYAEGRGVPKDEAKAAFWLYLAARQRVDVAISRLGRVYGEGMGVAPDHVLAAAFFFQGSPDLVSTEKQLAALERDFECDERLRAIVLGRTIQAELCQWRG